MAQHNETGSLGEQLAVRFLTKAGYRILATNWRYMKYEIDIVSVFENTLIFVEVKTRTPCTVASPEDSITKAKQKRLVEAADYYIKHNNIDMEARIDLVLVYVKDTKHWIKHIENAITPRW